jgi:hypothetical protein
VWSTALSHPFVGGDCRSRELRKVGFSCARAASRSPMASGSRVRSKVAAGGPGDPPTGRARHPPRPLLPVRSGTEPVRPGATVPYPRPTLTSGPTPSRAPQRHPPPTSWSCQDCPRPVARELAQVQPGNPGRLPTGAGRAQSIPARHHPLPLSRTGVRRKSRCLRARLLIRFR